MTRARSLKAVLAAVGLGTAYGAVCGAVFGLVAALIMVGGISATYADRAMAAGAVFGGILGALGGFGFGLFGSLIGGIAGWGLAGAVGGAGGGVFVFVVLPILGGASRGSVSLLDPLILIPACIGGIVGIAFGVGVKRRRSPLPGVTQLAQVINPDPVAGLPEKRPVEATALLPAVAPEGRGDEVAAEHG